ncbi:hypothetical protein [Polaromonas sp. YR568]|uniref:hypothetical protein n=1 Tax=Polaromonas sp. YR568 TaxID=1855301 RepID=UPI00398BDADB
MSDESLLPFLSQFDPPETAEGSLDPLGFYSIADALGVKLAPGVRERQSKPRYLTLALVGMLACSDLEAPHRSIKSLAPWLVYEWLIVESLVRELQNTPALKGIPGQSKVLDAINAKEFVCDRNYLRTPTVFGFHGIYRVLGLKLGLFDVGGQPLQGGYRVLSAWQSDQKMQGFVDGSGPGQAFRQLIEKAVRTGLDAGHARDPGPKFREFVVQHLAPRQPGELEREALWNALTQHHGLRGEYAQLLTSADGQKFWTKDGSNESTLHRWMLPYASQALTQLLVAIQAFERLARLLTDAFDEMRYRMTEERSAVDAAWLANGECVLRASHECLPAFQDALRELGVIDPALRTRLDKALQWIGDATNPEGFSNELLAHHSRIQQAKPPSGKRPWLDAYSNGRVAIRPAYTVGKFETLTDIYVQAYRTVPLQSFALDLKRVVVTEAST